MTLVSSNVTCLNIDGTVSAAVFCSVPPIRDRRLSCTDSGALVYLVISEKQPAKGPITSYVIQRTDDEIDQVLNLAHDPEERDGTAYLGMSFERGVEWTCGLGNGVPRCPEEGP